MKKNITLLSCLCLTFIMFIAPFHANAMVRFMGDKADYNYVEKPGTSIQKQIVLKNVDKNTKELALYITNAEYINDGSTYYCNDRLHEKNNLAKWMSFSEKKVSIPGKTEKTVMIDINVPADVEVGDYIACFVSMPLKIDSSGSTGEGMQVVMIRTSSKLASLKIPGKANMDLVLGEYSSSNLGDGLMRFVYDLKNNGNVIIKPTLKIDFYDFWGNELVDSVEKEYSLAPTNNINPEIEWEAPKQWRYSAKTTISYGDKTQEFVTVFNTFNWMMMVVYIIGLLVLFSGVFIGIKKIKKTSNNKGNNVR